MLAIYGFLWWWTSDHNNWYPNPLYWLVGNAVLDNDNPTKKNGTCIFILYLHVYVYMYIRIYAYMYIWFTHREKKLSYNNMFRKTKLSTQQQWNRRWPYPSVVPTSAPKHIKQSRTCKDSMPTIAARTAWAHLLDTFTKNKMQPTNPSTFVKQVIGTVLYVFPLLPCGTRKRVECKVWSVKCGVWSVEWKA